MGQYPLEMTLFKLKATALREHKEVKIKYKKSDVKKALAGDLKEIAKDCVLIPQAIPLFLCYCGSKAFYDHSSLEIPFLERSCLTVLDTVEQIADDIYFLKKDFKRYKRASSFDFKEYQRGVMEKTNNIMIGACSDDSSYDSFRFYDSTDSYSSS